MAVMGRVKSQNYTSIKLYLIGTPWSIALSSLCHRHGHRRRRGCLGASPAETRTRQNTCTDGPTFRSYATALGVAKAFLLLVVVAFFAIAIAFLTLLSWQSISQCYSQSLHGLFYCAYHLLDGRSRAAFSSSQAIPGIE